MLADVAFWHGKVVVTVSETERCVDSQLSIELLQILSTHSAKYTLNGHHLTDKVSANADLQSQAGSLYSSSSKYQIPRTPTHIKFGEQSSLFQNMDQR